MSWDERDYLWESESEWIFMITLHNGIAVAVDSENRVTLLSDVARDRDWVLKLNSEDLTVDRVCFYFYF